MFCLRKEDVWQCVMTGGGKLQDQAVHETRGYPDPLLSLGHWQSAGWRPSSGSQQPLLVLSCSNSNSNPSQVFLLLSGFCKLSSVVLTLCSSIVTCSPGVESESSMLFKLVLIISTLRSMWEIILNFTCWIPSRMVWREITSPLFKPPAIVYSQGWCSFSSKTRV